MASPDDLTAQDAGESFRLGPWLVSPSLGQLSDAEETVRLEPKVMDLLVYLARSSPRVVSKEEILDAVWPDTVIGDDALHRYVSKLRRWLGDDPRQPRYIETIPKRGYRLIMPVRFEAPAGVDAGAGSVEEPSQPPAVDRPAWQRLLSWQRLLPWGIAALATGIALASLLHRGENVSPPEPSPVHRLAALSSHPEAFELYLQSLTLAREGAPNQRAIQVLEQVVETDPGFAPAWDALGERLYYNSVYHVGGEPDLGEAMAASRRAAELDPELLNAPMMEATVHVEGGQLRQAYDAARELLDKYPHRAEPHFIVSYVYRYGGLLEEAARECDVALSIAPNNYRFRSCAIVFMRLGRFARALDFIRLDETAEVGIYHRGYLYFHQGRIDDAQRAWRRLPEGSWAFGLLEACRDRPESPDTRAFIEQVQPTVADPEAWYFVALTMNACGEPERALGLLAAAAQKGYCAASAFELERFFANLSELEGWEAAREGAESCRAAFSAYRDEYPAPHWPGSPAASSRVP